jgi:hypothetical protein
MANEKKELPEEYQERLNLFFPQLPDEMRVRAKAVWEAALYAHLNADPGEPSHISVLARALRDAEIIGPRPSLKGDKREAFESKPDLVRIVADKILMYADENGKDPHHVLADISKRLIEK